MPYARPGVVQGDRTASTLVATTSLVFTGLAYLFVVILANEWLLYGQDSTRTLVGFGVPATILLAIVLGVISRLMKAPNRGLSYLALVASCGSLLLMVGWVVYAFFHMPG